MFYADRLLESRLLHNTVYFSHSLAIFLPANIIITNGCKKQFPLQKVYGTCHQYLIYCTKEMLSTIYHIC